jgi:hypothetical protein
MSGEDEKQAKREFFELVNMGPATLEKWLASEQSKSVGWDAGDGEAVGHKSGKKIVGLLRKKRSELTRGDIAHMRKVAGYIKRHLAQRPKRAKIEESPWRFSLMNWGHDPLKHA